MRVLVTTLALDSHFYNTVPIAWALRSAGHEVRVASQPDLVPTITRAGLTAVPVGRELNLMEQSQQAPESAEAGYGSGFNIAETDPAKLTWEYVRDTLAAYAHIAELSTNTEMLTDLTRFARAWQPDLVLWDAMSYVGPAVARACGAAHARLLFGTDHWARMRELYLRLAAEQPEEARVDALGDWITGKLAGLGCAPEGDGGFDEELVVGQRTIDPLPSFLRIEAGLNRIPVRPVAYNGPSVVPDWVTHERPERPRVVLTLGLTLPEAYNDGFPITDLLAAAAEMDVELIATVGSATAESLSGTTLPENVRLVDFVPLNELLPTCSAIIHHGGMGTLQNTLRHGVPQVIVPGWLWDERATALAVQAQGAGLMIEPREFRADTLQAAVERVLNEPSFADSAERLAKELLSAPAPRDIVPELERLAAERA
ncbi:activator-dependent family glycosyltransferase [Streptomyces rochei]|nr:activator-dependent family glycosyltransferase [Streptomyces rochei]WMI56123.1 activator-dependent family glycosyltransferase [Streptomyces rochei]